MGKKMQHGVLLCIVGPPGTPCEDLRGFSEGEGVQQGPLETGERRG